MAEEGSTLSTWRPWMVSGSAIALLGSGFGLGLYRRKVKFASYGIPSSTKDGSLPSRPFSWWEKAAGLHHPNLTISQASHRSLMVATVGLCTSTALALTGLSLITGISTLVELRTCFEKIGSKIRVKRTYVDPEVEAQEWAYLEAIYKEAIREPENNK